MKGYIDKKLTRHIWMICGVYACAGILWIWISDHLLAYLTGPDQFILLQSWKGILFVIVTTFLLFIIIGRKNNSIIHLFHKLRDQMQHFQATFEHAAVGIVHMSAEEKWIRINQAACHILGYDRKAFRSLSLEDIVHPEDLEKGRQMDRKIICGEQGSYVMEKRYITKSGDAIYTRLTKSGVRNSSGELQYLIGIIEEITTQKETEQKLKQSLREKERLLAEVHHRVKNNLAVISGLMELQMYNSDDERVNRVLKESMMRIKSMALIHEAYYEDGKLAHVMLGDYLRSFAGYVRQAHSDQNDKVCITLDADPLRLNINQALPCGLLLSELLIHACDRDTREKGKDEIRVALRSEGDIITLRVSGGFRNMEGPSLGMTIIQALVCQLEATLMVDSGTDATEVTISFTRNEKKKGSSSSLMTD